MNSIDRYMHKKRVFKYKRLKKLFRARDMASKYTKGRIRVSMLDKHFSYLEHQYYFTKDLAKIIIEQQNVILGIRPPLPSPTKRIQQPLVRKK